MYQQLRVSNISPLLIFVKRGPHATLPVRAQMTRVGDVAPDPPPRSSGTVAGLEHQFQRRPLEPEFVAQLMFQIADKRRREAFRVIHERDDRRRFNGDLGSVEQFYLASPPIVW